MAWGICALFVALALTMTPECNTKSVQKRGFADRPVYHAQPIQPILQAQPIQPVYHAQPIQPVYHAQPIQPVLVVKKEKKPVQDFSKIPGEPGVDFPLYHSVPPTSFHCGNVPAAPGMYADVETGCQAYHVCHDGREGPQGASFLCTNGTLFNQQEFTCDWWYNVNCHDAPTFYSLNLDPLKNPYAPKPKPDELKKIVVF